MISITLYYIIKHNIINITRVNFIKIYITVKIKMRFSVISHNYTPDIYIIVQTDDNISGQFFNFYLIFLNLTQSSARSFMSTASPRHKGAPTASDISPASIPPIAPISANTAIPAPTPNTVRR